MPSASPETATHLSAPPLDGVSSQLRTSEADAILLSPEDIQPAMSMAPRGGPGTTRSRAERRRRTTGGEPQNFAEAIFFEYGVVVFFGFREDQELGILEDVEAANVMLRKIPHDDWEVEECHYAVRCPTT